jgi:HEAT repeat protein
MLRTIAIGAVGLGFIVGAGWFTAHLITDRPSDIQPGQAQDQQADAVPVDLASAPPAASGPSALPDQAPPVSEAATDDTPEEKKEAYVAKRMDELQDLGMESDPAAVDAIISELNNPEPRIREAAVSAAVQFGSRDAIPRMENALARIDDPKEKVALQEAIEFLKLPTLTEALSQTNQSPGTATVGVKP